MQTTCFIRFLKEVVKMNSTFVSIAKRENNTKRGYLIVNPLQAKHVPVSPKAALSVFTDLAKKLEGKYKDEKILFISFAETATAIGSQVASSFKSYYIQTTREFISGVDYIFFSEEHSHATEQKLVKNDLDSIIEKIDRIIFVEDEVSTGKTILNIIHKIQESYKKKFLFSVLSILNSMTLADEKKYSGIDVDFLFLQKIDRSSFEKTACTFSLQGRNFPPDFTPVAYKLFLINGYVNARRLVDSIDYLNSCETFACKIIEKLSIKSGQKILVLGSEEFMFPAILTGKKIEDLGNCVKTHSTTRSPILVFEEKNYPLHSRFNLASLYDKDRHTYIYNLETYDTVLIITDSTLKEEQGLFSLLNALKEFSKDINVIRWVQ